MPSVRHDFCGGDPAGWSTKLMLRGVPLHFLCHSRWYGECTAKGAHGSACGRFFHRRHFRLPVSDHGAAIACFVSQKTRSHASEASEYTSRLVSTCPLDEIALGAASLAPVAGAVCSALSASPPPAPSLRSVRLLVEAGMFPLGQLPPPPSLSGVAVCDDAVWLCQRHDWASGRGPLSRRLHPSLVSAVQAVMAHHRMPREIADLICLWLFCA